MTGAGEYEVEMKFRLGARGDDACEARLLPLKDAIARMGGAFGAEVEQQDTYFAHPQRNFKETDEALRIRRIGDEARVTYKGPKIDATTKTRRELEFVIASEAEHTELFEALGFSRVFVVVKLRRTAHFQFQGWDVEACWDEIDGLGVFLELETSAAQDGLQEARSALLNLAEQLSLDQPERRGYLDMLMDQ